MATGQGWLTTLKEIANKERCSIPVDRTIEDAIELMITTETGVVVFIEEKKPVGVLTERDIVSVLHKGTSLKSPLSMVKLPPLTVAEDKTLLFGLNMLIGNNIRRIIVVDPQGNFVGVVTQEDLIRRFEGELYNLDVRKMDIISSKQPLRTVSTGDSLLAALEVMTKHKVGSVLVTETDKVVGIITERDILRIAGNKTSLSEKAGAVMSHPVISASIDSSMSEVLEIMKAKKIRRILTRYNDGTPFRVITNRDILRNIENSYIELLNKKIRQAREILDFLPEIIVEVMDVAGEQVIQWCNTKTKQEFGKDMAGLPITSLIPPETWTAAYPEIVEKEKIEKTKVEIGSKSFELSASYMKIQREGIIQVILIDATSNVELSTRDFLTGAYNRRKFDEILTIEMERARRFGHLLSIGLLDIDHFKTINDTYGHQAGDRALQELTRVLSQHIRKVDYLARYGGEEFVVLAPGTDLAGMHHLAEKLRHIVEEHAFHGQSGMSLSVGVAQYASGDTVAALIGRTDAALYRAKAKGRNRVERS